MSQKGKCADWQTEAKKQMALWRQGLQETLVLVHSKLMVEAAKKRGICVEKLVKDRDAEEGIQIYQSSSREVQRKVIEWEKRWKLLINLSMRTCF